MDLTQGTHKEKTRRAKKMMLYFGIASLIMSFAGLTSAFIVSSKREDWLKDFQLPDAFILSAVLILISSISIYFALKAIKKNNRKGATIGLVTTFLLGIAFVISQLNGYDQIIASGYHFTGQTSNITMSYIYIISALHIAHVLAGLISLIIVIYNHFKQKYNSQETLGFELAATFWHFVDILWLYLFFFLYFFG
jgi:cytochrome c oxidase subunit 3